MCSRTQITNMAPMANEDAHRTDPQDAVAPWRAMLLAHNRSLRAIENDLKAAGVIPLNWYDVLLELKAADEGLRMQELSERVVLSRTRVSRLVDELEAKDLVTRHPHPEDGRATLAKITKDGATALRAAAPIYLDGIERHFTAHLTSTEQRSITKGLSRVVAAQDRPPITPT